MAGVHNAPASPEVLGGGEGGAGARVFVVLLPVLDLLNANQGLHHRVKAKRVKAIREAAYLMARSVGVPPLPRAHIFGFYLPTDGRRRDPANWAPSAKAAVDGLVDAGVLVDDDDKHLIGPDMRLGELAPVVNGRRFGRLLLRITELTEGSLCGPTRMAPRRCSPTFRPLRSRRSMTSARAPGALSTPGTQ